MFYLWFSLMTKIPYSILHDCNHTFFFYLVVHIAILNVLHRKTILWRSFLFQYIITSPSKKKNSKQMRISPELTFILSWSLFIFSYGIMLKPDFLYEHKKRPIV